MERYEVTFRVNGEARRASVRGQDTLLRVLRDLGHVEVKTSCEAGDCGACAVLLDGEAVNACLVFAAQADGCEIVTVRGIGTEANLHPIQRQIVEKGGVQCGFCTPGIVVAAKALLDRNPSPSFEDIRRGLAGNLCRCTGYQKLFEAIAAAAEEMRE
ncbi:MAG: (2Fe-2S)-binding protein [Candidatus Tectomicrobia bacterium]|uniref:(2Fe-2S)-binding protein n=1 Tax=Tectimicrobiota bacterium TaxID=2528274 RepID=A0A932HWJ6_UNCTE|nr:(2Fe-2S)-binding protein [Candidatus Tectomicrobia bacterium]